MTKHVTADIWVTVVCRTEEDALALEKMTVQQKKSRKGGPTVSSIRWGDVGRMNSNRWVRILGFTRECHSKGNHKYDSWRMLTYAICEAQIPAYFLAPEIQWEVEHEGPRRRQQMVEVEIERTTVVIENETVRVPTPAVVVLEVNGAETGD